MSQTNYTPISLYYSATASATPSAGNLVAGELALNTNDGRLFYKDSSGVVQTLASKAGNVNVSSFSAGSTGLTPSTATTGAVTLAGTLNVSSGGTGLTTLTAGYIPYGNGTSAFSSSANMTFDGSTLTTLNTAYTGTLTGGTGIVNLGSGQFYKDASGNVGIGVTPSAWNTTTAVTALQLPNGSLMTYSNAYGFSNIYLSANAYLNSSGNWIFTKTNSASLYSQTDRQHTWYYAASGTAGTQITFTQAMTLDASGNLGIGTTSPSASAILDAQSTTKGVRMPNMTTTQKNAISSPAAGLMVFDTTLAKLCVYSGSAWQTITSI